MFGHDDDTASTNTGATQTTEPQDNDPPADGLLTSDTGNGPTSSPTTNITGAPSIVEPTEPAATPVDSSAPQDDQDDNPALPNSDDSKDTPKDKDSSDSDKTTDEAPETDLPAPVSEAPGLPVAAAPAAGSEDLLSIKQEALQQLSPLVDHLDQTPEEKFHTTMMMIQASDDQSLIESAFGAAKEITDDKTRAQALLDIINEINYFTQHQSTEQ